MAVSRETNDHPLVPRTALLLLARGYFGSR
jgi:hypothetical protein